MPTLHENYQDIAQILDDQANKILLKKKLSNPEYDFDALVMLGSKELVLPTIYCKLKEHDLLSCLPNDLNDYLEVITSLNRNRNDTILNEIKAISALFNKENIKHAFLKGSALLAAGYYKDIAERMIGDIDILVDKSQLELAQSILINTDYSATKVTFGNNYFEHKHLPRLIPLKNIAAVEIHRKLLHKKVKNEIKPINYLKNAININTISVGNINDHFWHTALNFNINDYGNYYNFLGLRSAYDLITLKKEMTVENYKKLSSQWLIKSLINKMALYFDSIEANNNSIKSKLLFFIFKKKQQQKKLRFIYYRFLKTIKFIYILINRLIYFIFNSSYRKDSFRDRKRIISILKNNTIKKVSIFLSFLCFLNYI